MIAIKPGYFKQYFRRFTKEMIKDYFKALRQKNEAPGVEQQSVVKE